MFLQYLYFHQNSECYTYTIHLLIFVFLFISFYENRLNWPHYSLFNIFISTSLNRIYLHMEILQIFFSMVFNEQRFLYIFITFSWSFGSWVYASLFVRTKSTLLVFVLCCFCQRVKVQLLCLVLQVLYKDSRVILERREAWSRYLYYGVMYDIIWYIPGMSLMLGASWQH